MSYRNPERRRVDALVQRAEIAGFAMPQAVMAAIAKEDGLRADLEKTRHQMADIPTASDLVSELRADGGLPADFGKRLRTWQEKTLMLKEQDRLLTIAIEEQEEAVYLVTSRESENLIKTQLQPRLAAIVAEVRKHAQAYPNVPWGNFDKAMELTDPDARAVYLAVRDASVRYGGIREALGLLYDDRQLLLRHEIKNIREIWPNMAFRSATNKPPWPNERVERLAWLVTHGAELWAPTWDEADEEELRQIAAIKGNRLPPNAALSVRGLE